MPQISHLLSALLFVPVAGAVLLALVPNHRVRTLRLLTLLVALLSFLLSLLVWIGFEAGNSSMQFVEKVEWFQIAQIRAGYHVGVDGISLFLVILTTFLMVLACLASWNLRKKVKAYMVCLLLVEVGMVGVFLALDLILFYVFWEMTLVPMYLLIGIWGGPRRIYAAVKFFLYTMSASLLMLAALIALCFLCGADTFDLMQITQRLSEGSVQLSPVAELLLFCAFFLAFAVKAPLFPFHTWLPDAHVEAPTAGSVLLAGVLLKMGVYGMLRFCLPLFPQASIELAPTISTLAVIGIIYGALVAMVQPDIKKLVAYSSVSHLGFVVLGVFSFNLTSMEGATYQMLNHGVSTGALFLLVGMIYDRRHSHLIHDFGGLVRPMPVYAAFFMIVLLSSIGLPGMNGFVGEVLILQGSFLERSGHATIAVLGIILAAVYMLWMYQRVFLGDPAVEGNRTLSDLNLRERVLLLPLVILIFWMGIHSGTFLRPMDNSIQVLVDRIEKVQEHQIYRVEQRGH